MSVRFTEKFTRKMTLEEMSTEAHTCSGRILNTKDMIVVENIWVATAQICMRIDELSENLSRELIGGKDD